MKPKKKEIKKKKKSKPVKKSKLIPPDEMANDLCNVVYHSAMGDGWHTFVVARASIIANYLKGESRRKAYWDKVIGCLNHKK